MTADELKSWRRAERQRLIAAREGLDRPTLERFRRRIDTYLERSFPGLAAARLAFCWPVRGEYDARRLVETLRERGAVSALPVVVGRGQPLAFREWHPGVALGSGPLGIPFPLHSEAVLPSVLLVPMNGWDDAGYRLGYGAGYFVSGASILLRLIQNGSVKTYAASTFVGVAAILAYYLWR